MHANIAFPPTESHLLEETITIAAAHLARRFSLTDPDLAISRTNVDPKGMMCWSVEQRNRLLDLLAIIPSGVIAMEQYTPSLVETSNNLGIVAMKDDVLEIRCLSRSSVAAAQEEIVASIESAARLAGADFSLVPPVFPPWRISPDSALLATVQASYRALFQRDPKLVTFHAGLECGGIQERIPGLDVVSLGPEIQHAHKPGERVKIPSVVEFYDLLCEVIRRLALKT
ncbi:MAG: M20/M25/M40 family metallo-hydrolase [Anaerolineales bacterium]|nr:M20/M25/M40 family metallo-hydrolase [Anaerolineales bacterium]